MKPSEFWDACNAHDWYYGFSDDGRVYAAGEKSEQHLRNMAPVGSENRKIYAAFVAHMFSGDGWENPVKSPKPERDKAGG